MEGEKWQGSWIGSLPWGDISWSEDAKQSEPEGWGLGRSRENGWPETELSKGQWSINKNSRS